MAVTGPERPAHGLDTGNRFMVSWRDGYVVLPMIPPFRLSDDEALNLAAWLVAVTGARERFLELLNQVEAT